MTGMNSASLSAKKPTPAALDRVLHIKAEYLNLHWWALEGDTVVMAGNDRSYLSGYLDAISKDKGTVYEIVDAHELTGKGYATRQYDR